MLERGHPKRARINELSQSEYYVHVIILDNRIAKPVYVAPSTRVAEIKEAVFLRTNIAPRRQCLIYAGCLLNDCDTCGEAGLKPDCMMRMVFFVPPGGGNEKIKYN